MFDPLPDGIGFSLVDQCLGMWRPRAPPALQWVSGVPRKWEPASTRPPKAPEPSRAAWGPRTRPGGARPLCESKKSQSAERSGAAADDAAKARRGGPGPQRGDGTDPGARRRASATCADALQRREGRQNRGSLIDNIDEGTVTLHSHRRRLAAAARRLSGARLRLVSLRTRAAPGACATPMHPTHRLISTKLS